MESIKRELNLVSFKASHSHGFNKFSYSIHTQDGEVRFSADYESSSTQYHNKSVDNVVVNPEDMKKLNEICDEYLIDANLVESGKTAEEVITPIIVEIVWENEKRFESVISLFSQNKNKVELLFIAHVLSFFDGLTQRFDEFYFDEPQENLLPKGSVALVHYSEVKDKPVSYNLRQDCDDFLLDADCCLDVVDAEGRITGSEEILLTDADVTREDMDVFNALCDKYNFVEHLVSAYPANKSYYEPSWRDERFDEICENIGFSKGTGLTPSVKAIWQNGVIHHTNTLPEGMAEEVREFFMSLVKRIQAEPAKKPPEGRVVSLMLSHTVITKNMKKGKAYVAMNHNSYKGNSYSFHLREDGGELLFDGHCQFYDSCNGNGLDRELKIEKVMATPEDMELLQKICSEKSLDEKWHSALKTLIEDKENTLKRDGDDGRHHLKVMWENGAKLDVRLCSNRDFIPLRELKSYFCELAKRLDSTMPAEGKITSFKLKGAYAARFAGGPRRISDMSGSIWGDSSPKELLQYEYHMCEEEGSVKFSALQSDHPRISNMHSSMNDIPSVENKHLEVLRTLCDKHNLASKIQDYHRMRWDDFDWSDYFIYDTSPNPNFDFFEIEWENGARCEGTRLPDEIREFFVNLVYTLMPHGTKKIFSCVNTDNISKISTECGKPKAADNIWTCSCGTANNTGKFCSECGKPKPVDDVWTCSCGNANNTGKFCSECGKPKPVDDVWTCSCGEGNKGKYCSSCGAPRVND